MIELSTFKVDCTPPEGFPIGLGAGDDVAIVIRDPLYMRGIVLDDGDSRCLIASLDYCGLTNRAHDEMVHALAAASDTSPDRVIVHCVHQHDTPLINFELADLLGIDPFPPDWWRDLVQRCASGAGNALERLSEVSEVGISEHRLHGFASNRRILGADGKVRGMRFSRCADPDLVKEPVGIIDPILRTVAFKGSDGEIATSLSFYATHPQVSNGRSTYSADAEGEALRLLDASPGFHTYFSGPFGNVTAGKYSSPDDLEGNLKSFGRLLADGISRNLSTLQWSSVSALTWTRQEFPFPVDADREALRAQVHNADLTGGQKTIAAANLSSIEYPPNANYWISLLTIGPARLLFAPGELFVEYQLFAQSLIPDEFLAMTANCSDNFLYLPLAENFPEEGYEVTSFRWCSEEFEPRFKDAVAKLLLR